MAPTAWSVSPASRTTRSPPIFRRLWPCLRRLAKLRSCFFPRRSMPAGFTFVRAVVTRCRPWATRPASMRANFLPPSASCGCVATASDRSCNRQSAASKLPGCSSTHGGGAVVGGVVAGDVVELLVATVAGTSMVVVVVVVLSPDGTVVLVVVVVVLVVVVGGVQLSPQHGRLGSCTVSSSGSIVAPAPITGGASRYSRRLRAPAVSVPLIVI